jgi:hypothetical protein
MRYEKEQCKIDKDNRQQNCYGKQLSPIVSLFFDRCGDKDKHNKNKPYNKQIHRKAVLEDTHYRPVKEYYAEEKQEYAYISSHRSIS